MCSRLFFLDFLLLKLLLKLLLHLLRLLLLVQLLFRLVVVRLSLCHLPLIPMQLWLRLMAWIPRPLIKRLYLILRIKELLLIFVPLASTLRYLLPAHLLPVVFMVQLSPVPVFLLVLLLLLPLMPTTSVYLTSVLSLVPLLVVPSAVAVAPIMEVVPAPALAELLVISSICRFCILPKSEPSTIIVLDSICARSVAQVKRGDKMSCFRPNGVTYVYGQYSQFVGRLSDAKIDAYKGQSGVQLLPVPCGKCAGCRLDRSKAWADRMLLEYATERPNMKPKSALFLTLTYDDEHVRTSISREGVPLNTLQLSDVQDFLSCIRHKKEFKARRVRYYYAGEYGDHTFRPHYHMILFGFDLDDFPDHFIYSLAGETGDPLYESDFLNSLWKLGAVRFSVASYSTFAYVGRYILKKQFGFDKLKYDGRAPPFSHMSLKPALGSDYFDSIEFDRVHLSDGRDVHSISVPRIVLEHIKSDDPDLYEAIKSNRRAIAAGKQDLLLSRLDQPWISYLKDQEHIYLNRTKSLSFRSKI